MSFVGHHRRWDRNGPGVIKGPIKRETMLRRAFSAAGSIWVQYDFIISIFIFYSRNMENLGE